MPVNKTGGKGLSNLLSSSHTPFLRYKSSYGKWRKQLHTSCYVNLPRRGQEEWNKRKGCKVKICVTAEHVKSCGLTSGINNWVVNVRLEWGRDSEAELHQTNLIINLGAVWSLSVNCLLFSCPIITYEFHFNNRPASLFPTVHRHQPETRRYRCTRLNMHKNAVRKWWGRT